MVIYNEILVTGNLWGGRSLSRMRGTVRRLITLKKGCPVIGKKKQKKCYRIRGKGCQGRGPLTRSKPVISEDSVSDIAGGISASSCKPGKPHGGKVDGIRRLVVCRESVTCPIKSTGHEGKRKACSQFLRFIKHLTALDGGGLDVQKRKGGLKRDRRLLFATCLASSGLPMPEVQSNSGTEKTRWGQSIGKKENKGESERF